MVTLYHIVTFSVTNLFVIGTAAGETAVDFV